MWKIPSKTSLFLIFSQKNKTKREPLSLHNNAQLLLWITEKNAIFWLHLWHSSSQITSNRLQYPFTNSVHLQDVMGLNPSLQSKKIKDLLLNLIFISSPEKQSGKFVFMLFKTHTYPTMLPKIIRYPFLMASPLTLILVSFIYWNALAISFSKTIYLSLHFIITMPAQHRLFFMLVTAFGHWKIGT